MLVDAQVSSIKTSFSRSIAGCASLHRRRAACTSARSCSLACRVFFEGEISSFYVLATRFLQQAKGGVDRVVTMQSGRSQEQFGNVAPTGDQRGQVASIAGAADPDVRRVDLGVAHEGIEGGFAVP